MSHLESGSSDLFEILRSHPRIDGFRTGLSYDHIDKLFILTDNIHKRDNSAAIFMDELLYNTSFASRHLCPYGKFIYLVREAKPTLNLILKNHPTYTVETAARYYCYRLRGIYEYVLRTPGAVFLTWDDLNSGNLEMVQQYLGLREPLRPTTLRREYEDLAPREVIDECQECYERYLYNLKHLN